MGYSLATFTFLVATNPYFSNNFSLDKYATNMYSYTMNPLLTARQRRNLSQQDLADITGYSRQMIQRYEAGRSNTAPVELCAFYDDAAGVPLGTHAQRYEEWIRERRAQLPLSKIYDTLIYHQVPKVALGHIRRLIQEYSDIRPVANNKGMTDEYFVSATLHVHPYSIQKWQQSGNVPTVLAEIVAPRFGKITSMRAEASHGEVTQED